MGEKIDTLGGAAQYDLCGEACGTASNRIRDDIGRWIYPAARPDGRRVAILRVLQTNACENNCGYCAQRAGRNCKRMRFEPDELASLFEGLVRTNRAHGLFLSSGVSNGPSRSMERMIDTVEIVRNRHRFEGYVHLKILPGAEMAAVERAVQLADRVSVNLEAPSSEHLAHLAGSKDYREGLWQRLAWACRLVEEKRRSGPRPKLGEGRSGVTTQFVVGGSTESDEEILGTVNRLYTHYGLQRTYYSAFQPVPETPLDDQPATPAWREHRLYQSDWLLRHYGFRYDELVFDQGGNLPREADPKAMWASAHPDRFPIEVNKASRHQLLRIPGVGIRSSKRILGVRRESKLRDLSQLKKLGVVVGRAAPFVLLDGRQPAYQMGLL